MCTSQCNAMSTLHKRHSDNISLSSCLKKVVTSVVLMSGNGPTLNLSLYKIFALLALYHSLNMKLCCFMFEEQVTKEPDISIRCGKGQICLFISLRWPNDANLETVQKRANRALHSDRMLQFIFPTDLFLCHLAPNVPTKFLFTESRVEEVWST